VATMARMLDPSTARILGVWRLFNYLLACVRRSERVAPAVGPCTLPTTSGFSLAPMRPCPLPQSARASVASALTDVCWRIETRTRCVCPIVQTVKALSLLVEPMNLEDSFHFCNAARSEDWFTCDDSFAES
jgi:hypothetical protein